MLERVRTYVDLLRTRAQAHGDRLLYARLDAPADDPWPRASYREFEERVRAVAAGLQASTRPGDRLLLLCPATLEFPLAFFACLFADRVAVPAYPPDAAQLAQSRARLATIVDDARPSAILTSAGLAEAAATCVDDPAVRVLTLEALAGAAAADWRHPDRLDDATAFIQYTSGSTGRPRGVPIRQAQLVAHQRHAHLIFRQPEANVTVSWLPFYHDMGLIGSMLYPPWSGGSSLWIAPGSFLRRPLRWLELISELRAGVSTGPSFAYDLCVEKATDDQVAALDLSCWTLAVVGAEPIRADVLDRFVERFGPAGFRRATFLPCYGLAEATLMVSGGRLEDPPTVRDFARDALLRGQVRAAEPGAPSWRMVGSGRPMPHGAIAIVDGPSRRPLGRGRVGSIWIRGPQVAAGYRDAAGLDRRPFAARLADDPRGPGWFETGDVGFVVDGELFVCGRADDRIERDGRTWFAQAVEYSAQLALDPKLASDPIALWIPSTEAAERPRVLLALSARRNQDRDRLAAQAQACAAAIEKAWELAIDEVVFVPPRAVAKTSSGKPRRFRWREVLGSGELEPFLRIRPER